MLHTEHCSMLMGYGPCPSLQYIIAMAVVLLEPACCASDIPALPASPPYCPLWVKSRHARRNKSCLLYPRKRTFAAESGMSAKCQ